LSVLSRLFVQEWINWLPLLSGYGGGTWRRTIEISVQEHQDFANNFMEVF
jgi:hypothetical protein